MIPVPRSGQLELLKLIDFPPRRKSGGALQEVPLLAKGLILPPQPLQLRRYVRRCQSARRFRRAVPAATEPAHRRRKPNPEIFRDLPLGSATRSNQPNRLVPKYLRNRRCCFMTVLLRHRDLSTVPKQVQLLSGASSWERFSCSDVCHYSSTSRW